MQRGMCYQWSRLPHVALCPPAPNICRAGGTDGCGGCCLPQVMEVLDTSRAAAMELLAEHAGSAERVINEFFGA